MLNLPGANDLKTSKSYCLPSHVRRSPLLTYIKHDTEWEEVDSSAIITDQVNRITWSMLFKFRIQKYIAFQLITGEWILSG